MSTSSATSSDNPQKHTIGLITAISYTVGDIVGSGIFISPTSILNHAGSVGLSLCLWALCAFISLFGALSYVELGTTIRKSGCDFAYLSHFGWRPLASSFMWVSTCLSYPAVLAIQAISFGEYIVTGLDSWITVDEDYRFMTYRLVGFSMLWPLMLLNFFSLKKVAGAFQIVATAIKLIVASVIIFTGLYHILIKKQTQNFQNSFQGSDWNPGNLVLGVYSGLFAYNGWDVLNFGAEEIENPRRTLPIAAISGIAISATVFILMNVSYFSVLSVEDFKNSPAVAVVTLNSISYSTFFLKFQTFAERTLGNFHYAIPFLISLLLIGSMNTTIFACSRYMYSGAQQSVMPTPLRGIHYASRSPRLAVFAEILIAICLSFIGNLDQLISYMSFALWSQRTCTQAGFIYFKLRGTLKSKNSFEVPIFVPIIFFIICIALLVIPITQNYHVAIYGLSMTAGGAIIYIIFIYPKVLPEVLYKINDSIVKCVQILFNCVIEKYVEIVEEDVLSEDSSILKLKL
ncbi:CRE-AAT-7 protein [Caenorhabditis remanei]|uniref:CRE-AAT-7 protein n=1 Tax=Caenorhabditis remanei TaxID=31234 RepID=E3MDM8_CAERE|nr:CRE-AAT-7 protein [Caenorhabditis remanei]